MRPPRRGSSPARSLAAARRRGARRLGAGASGRTRGTRTPGASLRQLVWFTWPAWPLALWTLWRWRAPPVEPAHRVSARLRASSASGPASAMGGSDRALMLGLPPLAVLAAFALPTLQRSTAAAIDWFSVFFFSIAAADDLGRLRLHPDRHSGQASGQHRTPRPGLSEHLFIRLPALRGHSRRWPGSGWCTGAPRRSRHPLWKSMVLPASGVSLSWLLVMTLLLPPRRPGAQLPLAGRTHQPRRAARRLHRRARHAPSAGRRARIPGRVSRRRRHPGDRPRAAAS